MREVFILEVAKCFKAGDSEYKCVGRGKMSVVVSVGLIEKVTFEKRLKDLNFPRGCLGDVLSRQGGPPVQMHESSNVPVSIHCIFNIGYFNICL